MSLRLSGQNQLSYLGVTPLQPPDLVYVHRDPISGAVANADYRNFNVGTLWLNPDNQTLWILVKKPNNTPLWIQLGITASGFLQTLTADNAVAVIPFGLNINLVGDSNITTVGSNVTHSVQVTLNPSITITNLTVTGNTTLNNLTVNGTLNTNLSRGVVQSPGGGGALFASEGTNGQILISSNAGAPAWNTITAGAGISVTNGNNSITIAATGGGGGTLNTLTGNAGTATAAANNINVPFGHTRGVASLGVGDTLTLEFLDSVNANLILGSSVIAFAGGQNNTSVGAGSVFNLTTGNRNSVLGNIAGDSLTSGSDNVLLGTDSGGNLVTGSSNIIAGSSAGINYTTNESNNIILGNPGVVADSGAIRIGTLGTHTSAYLQGITSVIPGSNLVTVDANGQLGISSGSGPLNTLTGNVGAAATPLAGNINIKTANTTVEFDSTPVAHQLTQDFALNNLLLGSAGLIAGASNNVGYGLNALNLLSSGTDNAGIGAFSLSGLTIGSRNTAVGFDSLSSISAQNDNTAVGNNALNASMGSNNTALGSGALASVISGTNNIAIGKDAASTFVGAEANNIIIGTVAVAGDSATTRIGTNGTQTKAFMAGVRGVAVAGPQMVTIDASGQLGSQSIPGVSNGVPYNVVGRFLIAQTGVMKWICPNSGASAVQSQAQTVMPNNGIISNLYIYTDENASTIPVTITINKNSVNTAITTTIGAGLTGIFTDLTHTATYAAGDLFQVEVTPSATGFLTGSISCTFTPI